MSQRFNIVRFPVIIYKVLIIISLCKIVSQVKPDTYSVFIKEKEMQNFI